MDSVIAEILRVNRRDGVQPHVLRRWQAHLRDVVQPQLDAVAELEARVAALESELASTRKGKKGVTA